MTSKVENLSEIKKCVQCGYCCKVAPCKYGIRIPNTLMKESTYPCKFLRVDDPQLETYYCERWYDIKDIEKNVRFPMFGSGCSSTLLNTDRDAVMKRIVGMAVDRLQGEITHEDR